MTAADPDESNTPIMPTCVKNGSSTQGGLSSDIAPAKLSQEEPGCLKESTGLQSIKPHPGCLILGNDAQRGNKYVTRYRSMNDSIFTSIDYILINRIYRSSILCCQMRSANVALTKHA